MQQAQHVRRILPAPETAFPFQADRPWKRLKAWDVGTYEKTKALAVFHDDLWVGLGARAGTAAVWQHDGQRWTEHAFRDDGAEPSTAVNVLCPLGDRLYAGTDNAVWAKASAQAPFRRITQLPWARPFSAYAMAVVDDGLHVGLNNGDRPRVFVLRDDAWADVSDGLPDGRGSGVYELHRHTDGALYASLEMPVGPAEIYRLVAGAWEKIGGGCRGSWTNDGFHYALSMCSYQDRLILSMSRRPIIHGNFTSIWSFDGEAWSPIAPDKVPLRWGDMHNFNATIVYRGHLLVGGGGHPAGNASIWAYAPPPIADGDGGDCWIEVGGHGVYGSWGGASFERLSRSRHASGEYVYRLIEWRGTLIAGFGLSPGTAQVWQYAPR